MHLTDLPIHLLQHIFRIAKNKNIRLASKELEEIYEVDRWRVRLENEYGCQCEHVKKTQVTTLILEDITPCREKEIK